MLSLNWHISVIFIQYWYSHNLWWKCTRKKTWPRCTVGAYRRTRCTVQVRTWVHGLTETKGITKKGIRAISKCLCCLFLSSDMTHPRPMQGLFYTSTISSSTSNPAGPPPPPPPPPPPASALSVTSLFSARPLLLGGKICAILPLERFFLIFTQN